MKKRILKVYFFKTSKWRMHFRLILNCCVWMLPTSFWNLDFQFISCSVKILMVWVKLFAFAYILVSEDANSMTWMMEALKHNNVQWKNIRVVMADKDIRERNVIKQCLPNVAVLICQPGPSGLSISEIPQNSEPCKDNEERILGITSYTLLITRAYYTRE